MEGEKVFAQPLSVKYTITLNSVFGDRFITCGYSVRNASAAAAMVLSMIAFVCMVEMNPDSNCDGARYTPFSNIFWKNFPNRILSATLTVFQSTGLVSLKKVVNMAPTRVC